jgi:A/G-specific adenine glycosylase
MKEFPPSMEEFCGVPGIGTYAVASVECLAFGKRTPMVDVNTTRVLSRIFDGVDKVRYERALQLFARVDGGNRAINLALLDLAHHVCKARKPTCGICPAQRKCSYVRHFN